MREALQASQSLLSVERLLEDYACLYLSKPALPWGSKLAGDGAAYDAYRLDDHQASLLRAFAESLVRNSLAAKNSEIVTEASSAMRKASQIASRPPILLRM